MGWDRWLWIAGLLMFPIAVYSQAVQKQVTFEAVIATAQARAAKAFKSPKAELPEFLKVLNYDTYRQIQFRHEKALWSEGDLPFRLEFYHPGYLYDSPVKLNEFNSTHMQPIRFVEDFFNYGNLKIEKRLPQDMGYAGFRILNRLNNPQKWDEVGSFLGSSYFRMLGQGQRYGASARGLAINSGESEPEEFPLFTDWWLGKPEKGANTIRLYAVLDSVNCAGAYEFLIRPGETTFAEITAVLFMRDGINQAALKTIGLAPLTSMFWFGENSDNRPDDFRAEVHDSDGLLIRGQSEDFNWRPLRNPTTPQRQVFMMNNVKGFGLLQRDRNFANYQDLYNLYEKTPGVWVEPRGNWGEGEIHLVELPAATEGVDNVVAFWNPKQRPASMQPFRLAYTLQWGLEPDAKFNVLKVTQTRVGADPVDRAKRKFVVDFGGQKIDFGQKPPEPAVHCGENAAIADIQVLKNESNQNWRVIFTLLPKAGSNGVADIDCALRSGTNVISETWRYQWNLSSSKIARN